MKLILFHVTGVNQIDPAEEAATRAAAARLGAALVIRPARRYGPRAFPDNPVKNLLILGMMADCASSLGVVRFTEGQHTSFAAAEASIEYNWSCGREILAAGAAWLREAYPPARWAWWLQDTTEALRVVCARDPGLLEIATSCVMPWRFRAARRRGNEAKYGAGLMLAGRCGSCWKCAEEYLTLVCMGHARSDGPFIRHSLEIYRDGMVRNYERGKAEAVIARNDLREIAGIVIEEKWLDNAPILEHIE